MLRNDNKLNKRTASKIVKDFYGKTAALTSFQRLTGGKTAATYRLVSNLDSVGILVRVAHVNQKSFLSYERTMMKKEKETLDMLLKNQISVPRHLKYCPYGSVIKKEYNIYEFIISDIPSNKDEVDCGSFDDMLDKIHKIEGEKFGFCSDLRFDTWYDFIVDYSNELINEAKKHRFFKEDIFLDDLKNEIANAKDVFNEINTPFFVHNDIGRKNCLYKLQGGKYKFFKLIDIERSLFGDIDFEFQRAELTDYECYKSIMNDKKKDLNFNRIKRLRIYSLLHYLSSMFIMKVQYKASDYFIKIRDYYISRFSEKENYNW